MKSGRASVITIFLFIIIMFNNNLAISHATTANTASVNTSYSGLKTNSLILNQQDLNFTFNQNFTVFLKMENNGQYNIYDLNFNYTVDTSIFSVLSSSNQTLKATSFVYYNIDKIVPGQVFTFNMTLRVVSNSTQLTYIINPITLNYNFGYTSTDNIPGSSKTNQLAINILAPNTAEILKSGVLGNIKVDSNILLVIFAFPIVLAFFLSFYFGRRRNKL